MRRPLSGLVRGLFLVLATGVPLLACSSSDDAAGEDSEAVVDAKACPNGLIDMVVQRDESHTLFRSAVASTCLASTNTQRELLGGSVGLEKYFSAHPFVTLDKKEGFLAGCIQRYETSKRHLTEDEKVAVIGNYYFLMNTLKQHALATLEAVAGLDMLAGEETPLPEAKGPYSHPYLHESSDWERRLREHCDADPSRREAIIEFTSAVLWNVRKINAAIDEANGLLSGCNNSEMALQQQCDEQTTKKKELEKARDALIASAAPWLRGKEMVSLLKNKLSLEWMVKSENRFNLVDQQGVVQPKSLWKDNAYPGNDPLKDAGNPMVAQEAEVRAALPKQMQATRIVLMNRLREDMNAADFLHLSQEARISEKKYQEILAARPSFDPMMFTTYYGSPEVQQKSIGQLKTLEPQVQGLLQGKLPASAASLWPATTETNGRIVRLEAAIAELGTAGVDVQQLKNQVDLVRRNYDDLMKGLSASGTLINASCRNDVRGSFDQVDQTVTDFEIGAGLTIATAGLGSWLAAARAGFVAGETANVGLAWASAARVSIVSARAAQLARSAISYENQAKILWGVLLASNPYFIGDSAISSIQTCNQLINDNALKLFDVPFDLAQVQCLEGKAALSTQAIADYKACAVNVVVNVALNSISGYFAAREMRHGFLGPK